MWFVVRVWLLAVLTVAGACAGKQAVKLSVVESDAPRHSAQRDLAGAESWSGWIVNPSASLSGEALEAAGIEDLSPSDSPPLAVSFFFWLGVVSALAYVFVRLQRLHHK